MSTTQELANNTEELATTGYGDRALLLVGYAGGFRRSELAQLAVEDANFTEVIRRHSNTDQEGRDERSLFLEAPIRGPVYRTVEACSWAPCL